MILCLTLSGCASSGNMRGGVATIGKALMSPIRAMQNMPEPEKGSSKPAIPAGDGSLASITQPENPAQQSAQNYDYTKEDDMTFSAPTRMVETVTTQNGGTITRTIEIPAGTKRTSKESQKVGQVLGAAQKDTGRENSAMLSSLKWVQYLGVIVMLAGVVGFSHPAARLLIGGKDTAVFVGLTGLGMIVGPFLLVQYANWFAGGVVLAAAYWFLSRSKYKEAQLDTLKEKESAK